MSSLKHLCGWCWAPAMLAALLVAAVACPANAEIVWDDESIGDWKQSNGGPGYYWDELNDGPGVGDVTRWGVTVENDRLYFLFLSEDGMNMESEWLGVWIDADQNQSTYLTGTDGADQWKSDIIIEFGAGASGEGFNWWGVDGDAGNYEAIGAGEGNYVYRVWPSHNNSTVLEGYVTIPALAAKVSEYNDGEVWLGSCMDVGIRVAGHQSGDDYAGDLGSPDGPADSNPSGVVPADMVTLCGVPEPGTLALLIIGLIGLLAYAWRRRR